MINDQLLNVNVTGAYIYIKYANSYSRSTKIKA